MKIPIESAETFNANMEEGERQNEEVVQRPTGTLPDSSTLSDNNILHNNGLNYCSGENSGNEPLIINNSGDHDHEDHLYSGDTSHLVSRSDDGNETGDTHAIFGTMLIVNAALGAGLLNFPSAFHEAGGVVAGNLVQLAMLIFIYPALLALAFCSDWHKSKTLQEVLLNVWGRRSERATSTCVALYCFGTCITFLIIMGDQFDRLFASLFGPHFCHTWYLNRTFTICTSSIVFVLPFCYPKKIDFLKHISSVGVVAVIYVAGLIILQYYRGIYVPGEIRTAPNSWTDLFLVVPSLCFAYQCHVSVIPIYSCYKNRTLKSFAGSSFFAIALCVAIYTIAATFGYLTFGSKISSDILESYDANDPLVLIAIIAISIKTFSTYPILSFCGVAAVQDMWVDSHAAQGVLQVDPRIKERFRLLSVTIWFTLSLVFAIFMPNIGSVIKLLGSLAAIFIFIFPGMCILKIAETSNGITFYSSPRTLFQVCGGLFLCLGGFLFGVVTTNAIIYDFIMAKVDSEPICLPLDTSTSL